MANIASTYDPEAEPSSGYTPLPVGEYQMEIVESDYVATQSGNGMILKCKAQIIGGEYDQRPFYINYNLENANEQAQEIGQRDFAGLRRATGVLAPDDSEQLHFVPFNVKIGIKARKDTGELENVIKQYVFGDGAEAASEPRRPGVKTTDWRKAA
jgi:hypothetical protein